MKEQHFTELPSQGSIYSVARFGTSLVVGTGNHGKLYSYNPKGSLDELSLQDLPAGIDIIAIETYEDVSPVLCLTATQKDGSESEEKTKASLYIYNRPNPLLDAIPYSTQLPHDLDPNFSSAKLQFPDFFNDALIAELIDQTPKIFPLDFIPYDLIHIPVKRQLDFYDHLLILTGSDTLVHAYKSEFENTSFSAVSIGDYFPELSVKFDSIVTRLQIETFNETTRRITLCGCEDGTLHIWIVKSSYKSDSVTPKSREASREDFPDETEVIEKFVHFYEGMINCIQSFTDGFHFNVVVASACSPTYVYTNTLEDRFSSGLPLKFSSRFDSVEAVCVADIDLDGRAEIIIGTFGCTMLVYKYMEDVLPQWLVVAYQKFSSGILHIDFINYSLQVVTVSGIHWMQYSTSAYFHKHSSIISGSIPEEIIPPAENNTDDAFSDPLPSYQT